MNLPGTSDPTALIALDWGTSSLRAYRFGAHGKLLEKRALPWGIMNLPALPDGSSDATQGFRLALLAACGDWVQTTPGIALIAAGMIGSKQGWREAPYLDTPQALNAIGNKLTVVDAAETGLGIPMHIVPGMLQHGALPNVMRGEETQVAGILDQLQIDDLLVGLPGTHSKWVHVHNKSITHFDTFMTGETYAALCKHTILGRTMQQDGSADDAAFLRGAAVAKSTDGRAGVLSNIFSSRTLGLTGALSPRGQTDYLSGLLIGHEIAALLTLHNDQLSQPVALVGDDSLCQRYRQVLALYGVTDVHIAAAATEHGLWQLAVHAGLAS